MLSACAPPFRMLNIGTGRTLRLDAPEVGVERPPGARRRGLRDRKRDAEDGVGTEAPLVRGAIELDHETIDLGLAARIPADELAREDTIDVRDRLLDTLSLIALRLAVAELDGLVLSGRGARRNRGAPERAVVETNIDLDRGVGARIENLARMNPGDPHRLDSCGLGVVRTRTARLYRGPWLMYVADLVRERLAPPRFLQQRFALVAAAFVSLGLIVAVLFGSRGLLQLGTLKMEERTIQQRLAVLLLENQRLHERLQRLRTDDRTLERLAREQLGFVRPGEIVYRFPGRPRPGPGAAPP